MTETAWRESPDTSPTRLAEERVRSLRLIETETMRALSSDFLALMAHELSSPVTEAMIHLDAIVEGRHGPLSHAQRGVLQRVNEVVDDLREVIEAALDAIRLDAGQMSARRREVDVARLLAEVRAEFRVACRAAGLRLRCSAARSLPCLTTDPGKLKIILRNLLRNAVKYTARGTIRLVAARRGDGVAFFVTDTGAGIPVRLLPLVFEPFRRLRPPGRGRGARGNGLGLYIVRRFVELLGGTISVDSAPGKGSTFCVWVPVGGCDGA